MRLLSWLLWAAAALVPVISTEERSLSRPKRDSSEKRIVCYYTNWSVYRPGTAKFSPQNINPYLCTHLVYAFGGLTKDNALKPFDKYQDIEQGGYAKFNGLKTYNKNLKTMVAIGGWNEGSARFSPLVADSERRRELVKNTIKFLRQNHFDGLDLDWEYPSFRDGGKPRDRDNYATLVQEFREEFDRESQKTGRPRLLLTMAVPAGIEYIDKGYDVKKLNKYLDWMNILSYDYHSAFEPSVNHHSPLFSIEEDDEYNFDAQLNIDHTVQHYIKLGADRNKLVLGIPTYGRSYTLFNPDATEIGAPADGPGEQGEATREKGYLAYYEICEKIQSGGWTVENTNSDIMGPYAYKDNQWVGYDDENIVRAKSKYVNDNDLGGIMFWSIDNDDFRGKCHGKPYPLIEAAKEALLAGANELLPRNGERSRTVSRKESESSTQTTKRRKSRLRNKTTSTTEATKSKASKGTSTTPLPPTTPDPGSDFTCKEEGFYPHPRDCKKYFWCLDSGPSSLGIVAHQFTCPSGLVFNKISDSCDYPRNVICKNKTPETSSTTSTTSTTTTTTTTTPRTTTGRSRVITASPPRTTTTTAKPEESEEYEEYEDDEEEDPGTIKELLNLIKKLGGIEQLEKQLSQQSPDDKGKIKPSLYSRVLQGRTGNRFRGVSQDTSTSKYVTLFRNRPNAPQSPGSDEKEESRNADKPRYVTIQRNRPKQTSSEEEEDQERAVSEEDDRSNNEETRPGRKPSEKRRRKRPNTDATTEKEYVTLRRTRPAKEETTTAKYKNIVRTRSTTQATVVQEEDGEDEEESDNSEEVEEDNSDEQEEEVIFEEKEPVQKQKKYSSIIRDNKRIVSEVEESKVSDEQSLQGKSTSESNPPLQDKSAVNNVNRAANSTKYVEIKRGESQTKARGSFIDVHNVNRSFDSSDLLKEIRGSTVFGKTVNATEIYVRNQTTETVEKEKVFTVNAISAEDAAPKRFRFGPRQKPTISPQQNSEDVSVASQAYAVVETDPTVPTLVENEVTENRFLITVIPDATPSTTTVSYYPIPVSKGNVTSFGLPEIISNYAHVDTTLGHSEPTVLTSSLSTSGETTVEPTTQATPAVTAINTPTSTETTVVTSITESSFTERRKISVTKKPRFRQDKANIPTDEPEPETATEAQGFRRFRTSVKPPTTSSPSTTQGRGFRFRVKPTSLPVADNEKKFTPIRGRTFKKFVAPAKNQTEDAAGKDGRSRFITRNRFNQNEEDGEKVERSRFITRNRFNQNEEDEEAEGRPRFIPRGRFNQNEEDGEKEDRPRFVPRGRFNQNESDEKEERPRFVPRGRLNQNENDEGEDRPRFVPRGRLNQNEDSEDGGNGRPKFTPRNRFNQIEDGNENKEERPKFLPKGRLNLGNEEENPGAQRPIQRRPFFPIRRGKDDLDTQQTGSFFKDENENGTQKPDEEEVTTRFVPGLSNNPPNVEEETSEEEVEEENQSSEEDESVSDENGVTGEDEKSEETSSESSSPAPVQSINDRFFKNRVRQPFDGNSESTLKVRLRNEKGPDDSESKESEEGSDGVRRGRPRFGTGARFSQKQESESEENSKESEEKSEAITGNVRRRPIFRQKNDGNGSNSTAFRPTRVFKKPGIGGSLEGSSEEEETSPVRPGGFNRTLFVRPGIGAANGSSVDGRFRTQGFNRNISVRPLAALNGTREGSNETTGTVRRYPGFNRTVIGRPFNAPNDEDKLVSEPSPGAGILDADNATEGVQSPAERKYPGFNRTVVIRPTIFTNVDEVTTAKNGETQKPDSNSSESDDNSKQVTPSGYPSFNGSTSEENNKTEDVSETITQGFTEETNAVSENEVSGQATNRKYPDLNGIIVAGPTGSGNKGEDKSEEDISSTLEEVAEKVNALEETGIPALAGRKYPGYNRTILSQPFGLYKGNSGEGLAGSNFTRLRVGATGNSTGEGDNTDQTSQRRYPGYKKGSLFGSLNTKNVNDALQQENTYKESAESEDAESDIQVVPERKFKGFNRTFAGRPFSSANSEGQLLSGRRTLNATIRNRPISGVDDVEDGDPTSQALPGRIRINLYNRTIYGRTTLSPNEDEEQINLEGSSSEEHSSEGGDSAILTDEENTSGYNRTVIKRPIVPGDQIGETAGGVKKGFSRTIIRRPTEVPNEEVEVTSGISDPTSNGTHSEEDVEKNTPEEEEINQVVPGQGKFRGYNKIGRPSGGATPENGRFRPQGYNRTVFSRPLASSGNGSTSNGQTIRVRNQPFNRFRPGSNSSLGGNVNLTTENSSPRPIAINRTRNFPGKFRPGKLRKQQVTEAAEEVSEENISEEKESETDVSSNAGIRNIGFRNRTRVVAQKRPLKTRLRNGTANASEDTQPGKPGDELEEEDSEKIEETISGSEGLKRRKIIKNRIRVGSRVNGTSVNGGQINVKDEEESVTEDVVDEENEISGGNKTKNRTRVLRKRINGRFNSTKEGANAEEDQDGGSVIQNQSVEGRTKLRKVIFKGVERGNDTVETDTVTSENPKSGLGVLEDSVKTVGGKEKAEEVESESSENLRSKGTSEESEESETGAVNRTRVIHRKIIRPRLNGTEDTNEVSGEDGTARIKKVLLRNPALKSEDEETATGNRTRILLRKRIKNRPKSNNEINESDDQLQAEAGRIIPSPFNSFFDLKSEGGKSEDGGKFGGVENATEIGRNATKFNSRVVFRKRVTTTTERSEDDDDKENSELPEPSTSRTFLRRGNQDFTLKRRPKTTTTTTPDTPVTIEQPRRKILLTDRRRFRPETRTLPARTEPAEIAETTLTSTARTPTFSRRRIRPKTTTTTTSTTTEAFSSDDSRLEETQDSSNIPDLADPAVVAIHTLATVSPGPLIPTASQAPSISSSPSPISINASPNPISISSPQSPISINSPGSISITASPSPVSVTASPSPITAHLGTLGPLRFQSVTPSGFPIQFTPVTVTQAPLSAVSFPNTPRPSLSLYTRQPPIRPFISSGEPDAISKLTSPGPLRSGGIKVKPVLFSNDDSFNSGGQVSVQPRRTTTPKPRTIAVSTTVGEPEVKRRKPRPFTKVQKKPAAVVETLDESQPFDYQIYDDVDEDPLANVPPSALKVKVHSDGYIECLDRGNFPHPFSCKKFISCAKMENNEILGWEYTCPKHLSFDPVGGICNWAAGLGCQH